MNIVSRFFRKTSTQFDDILIDKGFLNRLSYIVPLVIVYIMIGYKFGDIDLISRIIYASFSMIGISVIHSVLSSVNEIYSKALSSGALGGKLSGAGGGGFLQLYVPIDNQSSVKRALSNLLHVPFNFEPNGSQIIFNDPNKKNDKQINSSKITKPSFTELKDIK